LSRVRIDGHTLEYPEPPCQIARVTPALRGVACVPGVVRFVAEGPLQHTRVLAVLLAVAPPRAAANALETGHADSRAARRGSGTSDSDLARRTPT
jgi:hypothetical protein